MWDLVSSLMGNEYIPSQHMTDFQRWNMVEIMSVCCWKRQLLNQRWHFYKIPSQHMWGPNGLISGAHLGYPTGNPANFGRGFRGGPTCVSPDGLMMGSWWAPYRAHMGNLGSTHLGPTGVCPHGLMMGSWWAPYRAHMGNLGSTHLGPTGVCPHGLMMGPR